MPWVIWSKTLNFIRNFHIKMMPNQIKTNNIKENLHHQRDNIDLVKFKIRHLILKYLFMSWPIRIFMFIRFQILLWYWWGEDYSQEAIDFKGLFCSEIADCAFNSNKKESCSENNGSNKNTNIWLMFQSILVQGNFK